MYHKDSHYPLLLYGGLSWKQDLQKGKTQKAKADVRFHASIRDSPHIFFVEEVGSRYIQMQPFKTSFHMKLSN